MMMLPGYRWLPLLLLLLVSPPRRAWATAPAPLAQACAAIGAEQRPRTAALAALGSGSRFEEGRLAPLRAIFGRCFPTARGAWILVIESVKEDSARWSLVHLGRDGGRSALAPPLADGESGERDNLSALSAIKPPLLFDYDGDGEEEIYLEVEAYHVGLERSYSASRRFWTFRSGAITRYAPAQGIVTSAVEDFDGDGRPDLWTYGPYVSDPEVRKSVDDDGAALGDGGDPIDLRGPLLLAHALPGGGFSLQDQVARAAAKRRCPLAPSKLLGERSDVNVVCARLWGGSEQSLRVRLNRECDAARQGKRQAPGCGHPERELLLDFLKVKPPLQLP